MVNFFKKHYIISIIVGALCLAAGIPLLVNEDGGAVVFRNSSGGGLNVVELFSGIVMFLIGIYLIMPFYRASKNRTVKTVLMIELILIFVVSIFGFLLPCFTGLFDDDDRVDILKAIGLGDKDMVFWLGIIIYVIGFVEVIVCFYADKRNLVRLIFLGVGLITLGCYFIFGGFRMAKTIVLVVAWTFTIVGALLVIGGVAILLNATADNNKKKKADKPSKAEEKKK